MDKVVASAAEAVADVVEEITARTRAELTVAKGLL